MLVLNHRKSIILSLPSPSHSCSLPEISSTSSGLPFPHPLIPVYAQPFWTLGFLFLLPLFASWIIVLLFLDSQVLSLPLLSSLFFSPFIPKCFYSVCWPCSFWNFQMSLTAYLSYLQNTFSLTHT